MLSDLKHVLENVFNGQKEIVLDSPVEFNISGSDLNHYIIKVYMKGRSWKMVDDFNNEWTISTLSYYWQNVLHHAILSMRDSRVKPTSEYKLSL